MEQRTIDYYKVDTVASESLLPSFKAPVGVSIVEVLGHPEFRPTKTAFPKKDAAGNPIDTVDCAYFPVKYEEKPMVWIMNVTPLKTSKGQVNSTLYAQLCAIIAENEGNPNVVLKVHRVGDGKGTRYVLVKS